MALVVRTVWIALLFALFAPASHASEAPDAEAPSLAVGPAFDFDMPRYERNLRRWRVGLGLALAGPVPLIVGVYMNIVHCRYGCEFSGVNAMSVGFVLMGTGLMITGSVLAITNAWAGALVVRDAGIPVSTAASALSCITWVAGVTAFVVYAVQGDTLGALVSMGIGYAGMLALTAGQVAHSAKRSRPVRRPQFALAPAIGRSPGLAVAVAW